MASSILPAEGLTLEFMAKPIGAILLQPLVTGVALLASLKYPSELEQMLSTITKGAISALPLTRTLKVLVVAGIIYRLNRIFSRLTLNNLVSDKTWDWKREIILITGGSSGIGALIAQKLSDRNVKVVIFDISAPKATLPANVHFYKVDITSSSAIHSATETVRKEVGEPSVLINNAGVGWNREILQQTEAQIQLTFSVNIIAHFLMVREFAPAMIRRDHGHIVTIASMASFLVHAGNVDYAASKAAALAFHEGLAQELKARYGAKKVRTTVVHPTWVRTPLIEPLMQRKDFNEFILEPATVADAVVDQIFKGESAQLILPARLNVMSSVRGWPSWLQEGIRNSIAGLLQSPA